MGTKHGAVMAADLGDPDVSQLAMHARAVVVVLSSRTLESLPQLTAIVCSVQPSLKTFTAKTKTDAFTQRMTEASSRQGKKRTLIPVATPSFQFPGSNFYDVVLPNIWPGDVEDAVSAIQEFFKTIAVHLAINASSDVIRTQSRLVLS